MIKIAICDDLQEDRACLKTEVYTVWKNDVQIVEFEDSRLLVDDIKAGKAWDLIFMDIFLKESSGIDAAMEIRRLCPDAEIVLISNSREFGPEAFDVNALYYLVKPFDTNGLHKVRERYQQHRKDNVSIKLKIQGREQKVPFDLIAYVESAHNNLDIHLTNGAMLQIRGSIQEFVERLDDRFLRINRGIIVNMKAIEAMNGEYCEIGGMIFSLSRRRRTECRRIYNEYLFNVVTGKRS